MPVTRSTPIRPRLRRNSKSSAKAKPVKSKPRADDPDFSQMDEAEIRAACVDEADRVLLFLSQEAARASRQAERGVTLDDRTARPREKWHREGYQDWAAWRETLTDPEFAKDDEMISEKEKLIATYRSVRECQSQWVKNAGLQPSALPSMASVWRSRDQSGAIQRVEGGQQSSRRSGTTDQRSPGQARSSQSRGTQQRRSSADQQRDAERVVRQLQDSLSRNRSDSTVANALTMTIAVVAAYVELQRIMKEAEQQATPMPGPDQPRTAAKTSQPAKKTTTPPKSSERRPKPTPQSEDPKRAADDLLDSLKIGGDPGQKLDIKLKRPSSVKPTFSTQRDEPSRERDAGPELG